MQNNTYPTYLGTIHMCTQDQNPTVRLLQTLALALLFLVVSRALAGRRCPTGMTVLEESFFAEGHEWSACEDLTRPGGSILLDPVGTGCAPVWQPKTYEPFLQGPDSDYYLEMDKKTVLGAKWDMLGQKILTECEATERFGPL